LPQDMFYTTNISVTLWILNRNKKAQTKTVGEETRKLRNREKEILFLDLRQMGEPLEKKFTQLSTKDIQTVTETYHRWQKKSIDAVPEFCYSVSLDEVRAKDYSLVPSKYIEFVNRDENIDFDDKMKQLQMSFAELLKAETKSRKDLLGVFKELGYEIKL